MRDASPMKITVPVGSIPGTEATHTTFRQNMDETISVIRPETIWSHDLPQHRFRDLCLNQAGVVPWEAGKRGALKIPSHSVKSQVLAAWPYTLNRTQWRRANTQNPI